jgi:hypothetical protein
MRRGERRRRRGDAERRDLRLLVARRERRRERPPEISAGAGAGAPPLIRLRLGDFFLPPPMEDAFAAWMTVSYPAPRASLRCGIMSGSIGILFG